MSWENFDTIHKNLCQVKKNYNLRNSSCIPNKNSSSNKSDYKLRTNFKIWFEIMSKPIFCVVLDVMYYLIYTTYWDFNKKSEQTVYSIFGYETLHLKSRALFINLSGMAMRGALCLFWVLNHLLDLKI